MIKLRGLLAAPFTPLDDQGELMLDQIGVMARLFERNKLAGVFICGSTGEGASLTHEEKKEVMLKWGSEKGRLKVIVSLGGTCLKEMKDLAEHATKYDMDGIAILSPYYFRPASVSVLVEICRQIANCAPELPFYYYHIPALTHADFSMLEFLILADELIPNLAGIKFTSPDLMDFQACAAYKDKKYNLLWGTDEALLSGLIAGADGAVGSTYNYAAPLYHQIIEAYDLGEIDNAKNYQLKAVEMVQLLKQYGGTNAGKAFMKLIGVDCGWFRLPLLPIAQEELYDLHDDLVEIGFFEFCSR